MRTQQYYTPGVSSGVKLQRFVPIRGGIHRFKHKSFWEIVGNMASRDGGERSTSVVKRGLAKGIEDVRTAHFPSEDPPSIST